MIQSNSFSIHIFDQMFDAVCCIDHDQKIIYWNQGAERLTGYTSEEMLGKKACEEILKQENQQSHDSSQTSLMQTIQDGQHRQEELFLIHKKGHYIPVIAKISPLQNNAGEVIGAIKVFTDNSTKHSLIKQVKEIEQLAMHDTLTLLANRRYLEMKINCKLEELRRYEWSFGLLFIDIDNFKQINDTFGHDLGDEVLKHIAQNLNKNNRTFDINGRWGGEEFVSLISNVDIEKLSLVAERYRERIENTPLEINGINFNPTVSIGATVATTSDYLDTLIRRADQFMYQSKIRGRNCVTTELSSDTSS